MIEAVNMSINLYPIATRVRYVIVNKKSPAKRSFRDRNETLPGIPAHSLFQVGSNKRFAGLLVTYTSPQ
jgi:hypothetical protein